MEISLQKMNIFSPKCPETDVQIKQKQDVHRHELHTLKQTSWVEGCDKLEVNVF